MRTAFAAIVCLLLLSSVAAADPIRPALNRLFDPTTADLLWTRYREEPDIVLTILKTKLEEVGVPDHPPGLWKSVLDHLEKWEQSQTPAPLPEPATWMLFSGGLMGLAWINRRS